MMGWYGGGMNGGIWLVMGLFWLLLIGAIVWLVVQLATSGRRGLPPHRPWGPGPWGQQGYGQAPWGQTGQPGTRPGVESPFEVLDRPRAAGEIDGDTYQQQRAARLG